MKFHLRRKLKTDLDDRPSSDPPTSEKNHVSRLKEKFPGRKSFDTVRERVHSKLSGQSRKKVVNEQLLKRRFIASVAILDQPLITHVEFLIDPRYHSLKIIGNGSFGVVASAVDSTTNQRVAIKKNSVHFLVTSQR